ncbi:MAG: hypothetical protein DRJ66_02770 [Thermoprotei archaeon]|nr:MAG: hypothetical protein DRJ66_02770 [Thermoprotei archaeon]RLF20136.1 MAG: hypothetical protein DRZ82_03345 [Thermoprotei archaeon]
MAFELLHGEKVLRELKPTIISFISFYAVYGYPLFISLLLMITWNDIVGYIQRLPQFLISKIPLHILIIWLIVFIPGLIIALSRVDIKVFLVYLTVSICFTALSLAGFDFRRAILYGVMPISLLSLIAVELYRHGITYILTDYRIIIRKRFLLYEERSIPYDKIVDLFLIKGILGRIFNYGTILPITPSMVGLSMNTSTLSFGTTSGSSPGIVTLIGGAKSRIVPYWLPPFVLYGVPEPEGVYRFILEKIRGTSKLEEEGIVEKSTTAQA